MSIDVTKTKMFYFGPPKLGVVLTWCILSQEQATERPNPDSVLRRRKSIFRQHHAESRFGRKSKNFRPRKTNLNDKFKESLFYPLEKPDLMLMLEFSSERERQREIFRCI